MPWSVDRLTVAIAKLIHGVGGDLSSALVFGGFRDQNHLLSVFGTHSSKARKPSCTKGRRRVPKASNSARRSYRGVLSALKRRISLICFFKGSLTWVGRGTTPSYRLRITSVKAHICSLLVEWITSIICRLQRNWLYQTARRTREIHDVRNGSNVTFRGAFFSWEFW